MRNPCRSISRTPTASSSTAQIRACTWRSATASTAASARGLAELHLPILWEEIITRDLKLEVVGKPQRVFSDFIGGISSLPVRIAA